jgi:hypothetical protein
MAPFGFRAGVAEFVVALEFHVRQSASVINGCAENA